MTEPQARYEEVKLALPEPVHGLEEVTATLGIPEWWPTGARVSVVLAHGSQGDDPILEALQRGLTEHKILTLRFHFPFVEAGKKRPDDERIMVRTFRSAVALLGRDPTAAPAHLFVGGKNLGASAATLAANARIRIDGLFLLGLPLHKLGNSSELKSEQLFRVISPMLFVTGTRDRFCDLDALRRTTLRIGAPTVVHPVEEADHAFKVLKKSERTSEDIDREILAVLEAWIARNLGP